MLSATDQEKVLGLVFNRDQRPLSGYYKHYGRYYQADRPRAGRGWWR